MICHFCDLNKNEEDVLHITFSRYFTEEPTTEVRAVCKQCIGSLTEERMRAIGKISKES